MTDKTLEQTREDFINNLKAQGRATATILAYGKDLEQLIEFLQEQGKNSPAEVLPADIEKFRDSLRVEDYTAKSVSRKLNAVKTFFRWLVTQKVTETDPAAPVAHPHYTNPAPRILSKMEYGALRDAARDDERISAIIELMLQTGIRIGEVANLTLDDVKKDRIVIKPYESQEGREIPLNQSARRALDRYLKVRPETEDPHVFVTKTGRPLLVRNIRSAIDRYFQEAGIKDAKVNDLRNTFIAHHLKNGVDVVTVSRLAGHKRLSTTERYLQFIDRQEPGRGARLEEL